MTRLVTRWTLAGCISLAAVGAVAALGVAPATADSGATVTSEVFDPEGDTLYNSDAPFQDVVRARMTKTASGDFELLMEVAAPVPTAPESPQAGRNQIWWIWAFDLDATTRPDGYPFHSSKDGRPPEFMVYVSWDGTSFAGTAVDRRPLLTGGEAIVTSVPFRIDGTIIEADLASEVIGAVPSSFSWGPFTLNWWGSVGSSQRRWADYFESLAVFNP